MRKLITWLIAGCLTLVLALALTPAAFGHPSENRAEQAFFGGPHCHINQHSGKLAFPSHKAHIVTGLDGRVFTATACP